MRGLKVLLGLDKKLPRTVVSKDPQNRISKNTNNAGRKKSETPTKNSTTSTVTKCSDGTCGSGTLNKQKKVKVDGDPNGGFKTPTPKTPDTRKTPRGKLYMNMSGGDNSTPALNVGDKFGKLLNLKESLGSNDDGKQKPPTNPVDEYGAKKKGQSKSGFKFEVGIRKNGVDKAIVELDKKKK